MRGSVGLPASLNPTRTTQPARWPGQQVIVKQTDGNIISRVADRLLHCLRWESRFWKENRLSQGQLCLTWEKESSPVAWHPERQWNWAPTPGWLLHRTPESPHPVPPKGNTSEPWFYKLWLLAIGAKPWEGLCETVFQGSAGDTGQSPLPWHCSDPAAPWLAGAQAHPCVTVTLWWDGLGVCWYPKPTFKQFFSPSPLMSATDKGLAGDGGRARLSLDLDR